MLRVSAAAGSDSDHVQSKFEMILMPLTGLLDVFINLYAIGNFIASFSYLVILENHDKSCYFPTAFIVVV